jgi:hypothetical protein
MLHLKALKVQIQPKGDSPGVLQRCTKLRTLALRGCAVKDPLAAFAAIAALPELRSLCVERNEDADSGCIFGELQPSPS